MHVPMIPGSRNVQRAAGFAAGICKACRRVVKFRVSIAAHQKTSNFVAVSDTVTGLVMRCGSCGTNCAVGMGDLPEYVGDKQVEWAELLRRTFPDHKARFAELERENRRLLDGQADDEDRIQAAASIIQAVLEGAVVDLHGITWDVVSALCCVGLVVTVMFSLIQAIVQHGSLGLGDWAILGSVAVLAITGIVKGHRREFRRQYMPKLIAILAPWGFSDEHLKEAMNRLERGLSWPVGWIAKERLLKSRE